MEHGYTVIAILAIFTVLDLMIFLNTRSNRDGTKIRDVITRLALCITLQQGISVLSQIGDFGIAYIGAPLMYASVGSVLVAQTCAMYFWYRYMEITISQDERLYSIRHFLRVTPIIAIALLCACAPLTGWLFYVDEAGLYHRGSLFLMQIVCPYSYTVMAVVCALINRGAGRQARGMLRYFMMFVAPSVACLVVQMLIDRAGIYTIGASLGLIFMYFELYLDDINENRRLKSIEEYSLRLREINEQQKRTLDIVGCLSRAYLCIYYADLTTGSFTAIKPMEAEIPGMGAELPDEAGPVGRMARMFAEPEFEDELTEFADFSTVAERMKDKDVLDMRFRNIRAGWCSAELIAAQRDEGGSCTRVLFCVRSIQAQQAAEEEMLTELKLLKAAIDTVYPRVNKVNLTRDTISTFSMDKFMMESIGDETSFDKIIDIAAMQVPEEEREEYRRRFLRENQIAAYRRGEPAISLVHRQLGENGRYHWMQTMAVFVSAPEGEVVQVALARCVDEEIARQESLQEAMLAAERANAAKTLFLNNMSHDIRTPMNAILGFAGLMESRVNEPEVMRDYVRKIRESGGYLLSIINNVLDMARIESGHAQLDIAPVDLTAERRAILDMFNEDIARKRQHLTVESDVIHKTVLADGPRLRQIAVNLISNAIKYTPEGGSIRISVKETEPGIIVFEVEDTGIGMSKEFLEVIFDSFTRERTTTESRVIGTGLGMSIVKKLVDMMNGTISVDSEPGKGSRFTVTLPLRSAEQTAEPEDTTVYDFTGKRALIAEDNELNAEIALAILSDMGFEAERAADGVDCVDMLMKSDYDVVLMDIFMPNMNGFDATGRIRALDDARKANIPIIAMTANAFEEDRRAALAAGMTAHLTKPIEIAKLRRMLWEVLKM